jgi:hypothetical protein
VTHDVFKSPFAVENLTGNVVRGSARMKVATQIRRSCKRWKGRVWHETDVPSGLRMSVGFAYPLCDRRVKDDVTLASDRLSLAFLAIAVKVIPKGRFFALTDVFY